MNEILAIAFGLWVCLGIQSLFEKNGTIPRMKMTDHGHIYRIEDSSED